mmetsp:Transcript_18053/g.54025  ORF Transcript_18053/g.54025 Transcript_18053/m.54025 type:complete len:552 (+) Transcript_18053:102-1757(+)
MAQLQPQLPSVDELVLRDGTMKKKEKWIPEDDRPFKKLPHPPQDPHDPSKALATRKAGIHALEVYTPRHAVKATALEKAHGVDGKYTQGLMMQEFAGPGEDEDPVSMAATACSRLLWRYRIKHTEVGMMYVGSESLLDRAKSIKSNLMMLFEEHDHYDVEGCDNYNACYGGTAALLNVMNWVQSYTWDGRWGIAIATDIADAPAAYRFMVGASAVAMLIGVDAPMWFERERQTCILHRWDFYKPIGWPSMAPIVDGPGSIDVYFECLDSCQEGLAKKSGVFNIVDEHNYMLYHLGSGPKFVKHAFERTCSNAWGYKAPKDGLKRLKKFDGNVPLGRVEKMFEKKICPGLRLAKRTGPMHTAATYTNMTSLLIHANKDLIGNTINVFSYGSGCASTMFRLHVDALPGARYDFHDYLDSRDYTDPSTFDAICERYSNTYGRFGFTCKVDTPQRGGVFYLHEVDAVGRRTYHLVVDPEVKLSGPLICAPIPRTKEQQEFDKEAMKPKPLPGPTPEEEEAAAAAASAPAAPAAPAGGDPNALAGLLQLLAQAQAK